VEPDFSQNDFKVDPAFAKPNTPKGEKEETPLGYFWKSAIKGGAEQLGRNFESSVPLTLYGAAGLPESLVRQFVPREIANMLFPMTANFPVEVTDRNGKFTKSTVGKTLLSKDRATSPEMLLASSPAGGMGKAPGDLSRTMGRGAEFFGQAAMNPLGGSANLVKMLLGAFGAGVGSDLGEKAGRSIGEGIGGETGGNVGGFVGSVAGGGLGAQLNVMRGKALGAAADAGAAAWKMRKEEARGNLVSNFNDTYSAMHAESRGIIQQHVNERIAEALSKNADTPAKIKEIDDAAKTAGVDLEKSGYDLAQRTADPSLILMTETQKPRNLEEAMQIAQREQSKRSELVNLFKNLQGESAKAKDVVDSLEDLRQATKIKVAAIGQTAKKEADVVTRLSPNDKKAMGDRLQAMYEAEKKAADPVRNSWYTAIEQAVNPEKDKFDLSGVEKEAEKILGTSLAKVDPSTAPTAIGRLKSLIDKAKGTPETIKRVEKRPGLFENVKTEGKPGEPVTYKDLEGAIQAFNRERPTDPVARRNVTLISDALEKTLMDQAPKEVKDAFLKAQQNYKNLYAPRFREGVNFNLDRDASIARRGENYYAPDMGLDPYLNDKELVTRMEQFQNLFGGKLPGTVRNEEAFKDLSRAVQDKYSKEMFSGGKFSDTKHQQFMEKYQPVFKLVPDAQKVIESQALKVMNLEQEARDVEKGYAESVRSPLNATLGVDKANRLVSNALSDPRHMNRLISVMEKHGGIDSLMKDVSSRINIMKDGQFDPFRMDQVLKDGEPGLRVLFAKKFGPTQGEEHYKVLKAIATLGKRQTIADVRQMPPAERISTDPLKGATGSSGASFMSYWRSTTQGYTSTPYIGALAGGRYLNQQLQNSLKDAELKAFNDPEMAKAVLEMYSKKAGEPITMQSARRVFGSGARMTADMTKKFLDWMVDRGYVIPTTGKGAQLGATSALQEKKEKKEKKKDPYKLPDYFTQ